MISRLENIWRTYFDFHYGIAFSIGMIMFIFSTVILYLKRKKQKNAICRKDVAVLLLFSVYMTVRGKVILQPQGKEFFT